jgi:radical SAM protein with 4Fe4S-binding SPASM domain
MIQLAHRLVLTELCNGTCPHCFNAEFRKTAEMDADVLLKFWRQSRGNPLISTKRVKFMGGEPTLHPRIVELMREACLTYGGVDLFTNGSKMLEISQDPLILKYHLMNNFIQYIINGYTFDINKFMDYAPYISKVFLHFVIPYKRQEFYDIIGKMTTCMELAPFVSFVISPDTQVNLFDDGIQDNYRENWLEAITTIVPRLIERGIAFNYDHVLPMCFYTQKMLDRLHDIPVYDNNAYIDGIHSLKITCCGDVQMGLILPNFDIYFCNQTHIKLGSLLDGNGEPKSIEELTEMLQKFSKIKTESVKDLSPKCKVCPVVASCKVGCYYTTLLRSQNELSNDEL